MRTKCFCPSLMMLCFFVLVPFLQVWGQVTPERLQAIQARLEQVKNFSKRMPENQRRVLSSGALNLFQFANRWDEFDKGLHRMSLRPDSVPTVALQSPSANSSQVLGGGLANVSNPAQDIYSALAGFTQSETHTGWCGNNVVVGFNDSGSFFESLLTGVGGVSFNGLARSTNQGASYEDLTFLNPGPGTFDFLAGDPVIGCADANTFYYASLFETGSPETPLTAISVSKSRDAGSTFANPVVAVSKDAFTHFLDKEWMSVDPSNPSRIFVTYTDFDFTGKVCGVSDGVPVPRAGIEFVRSTNGGETWSRPLVIDEACAASPFADAPFLQGSQVAVNGNGQIFVAWEVFGSDFVTREIRIRTSHSNGKTFEPFVKVSDVACSGDCFALQGGFRAFLDLQSLAVDRSESSTRGNVYVAWHDSRNVQFPDLASPTGFYGYADALISVSSNGGAIWSAPVRINQNVEPLPNGRGTDQYMPGVAVDKTGRVEACFYDRRLDSKNFFFGRFCALSTDGGQTWTDSRQTRGSPSIHATDTLLNPFYMGDYDGMASDFTNTNSGFVGAFQVITSRGDPNVKAVKLP